MAVRIPLANLLLLCNPFGSRFPWGEVVTRAAVSRALDEGRLESQPGSKNHPARIAYLVLNRAVDPVSLDVGVPALGYGGPRWKMVDGNHRFAAALYRGDLDIGVEISGSIDRAAAMLGLPVDALFADEQDANPDSPSF